MNTIRQIKKALLIALLLGTASQSQAATITDIGGGECEVELA